MATIVNKSDWTVKSPPPEDFLSVVSGAGFSPEHAPFIAQLLWARGINTKEKIEKFFNPDYTTGVHDPFLFKGMEKAATRVVRAIQNKEKIIVFADYDADGVDGAVIMAEFLKKAGGEHEVFIPDRFTESYGLTLERIDEFKELGARVLITIDCGVTDYDEVEKANSFGMDVIILDHHIVPPKWPNAYAIIDHKQEDDTYPEKVLCGTGLAFKLVQAVLKKERFGLVEGWEKWFLDAVAIATVADMVPLTGENRVLVKYGVEVIKKMRRPGLKALLGEKAIHPQEITAETIGFYIAPRINAASRMDHANTAFELMLTDEDEKADWLARRLEEKNQERRTLVEKILKTLEVRLAGKEPPIIIFEGSPEWPAGVLGIAANRILEKYGCPVFLYGILPDIVKGSCRAGKGFNVVELMRGAEDCFDDFGGHAVSGGFSMKLENVERLKAKLQASLEQFAPPDSEPIQADAEIALKDVTSELYALTKSFEPFGQENPKPLFSLRGVKLKEVKHVGADQTHVKLKLGDEGLGAIYFRGSHNGFKTGDTVDILAELQENTWRGTTKIELNIVEAVKK
ncbi:MAG: single-stranded-DNA-specific exonuclease RecJ [Candidatus Sungbacteria bacterium RIFCSPLOWO2_02_FULL_47_9]|uniref:Single-stranded-DNA-specific exonuclease RecJ n=1 Tax=Candidatus Sungbacteria bacterium RIFCSPHIGHO2_01_FULL_47_32 TaxID=1802264 RepID=A0A1G2K3S2_9BACT|nr:MAG: Single-stranded-DNA-specific exonuclease RecJ [Parcubacteria group bacterium GW2011_GWA2_47_10]OGZ94062.1 MAG: single-stranded-DNA-specific exonuclease RecJ [Candidatus Sungbacteria bacterium RIFCSPHIGHO2_01_FULL_47_32]OHA05301.1 MAG: single-stranded-DNA-specific exonuclease RecJ [Candidatus Sungbacteria bacterium RIFCSPLOWO2_01_FULL_47_32]OHA10791.1 MAG: single-stranded-DNA-specific exonuclease RecJ [Candidatus Sungbacteria bacterium RIFCSPLOWO2_02_FULL_47_9]